MMRVELGLTYRDRATGITGAAVSRCEQLGGAVRVSLESRSASNGLIEQWFNEQRLELVPESTPGSYA